MSVPTFLTSRRPDSGGFIVALGTFFVVWLFMAVWWNATVYPFAQVQQSNPYWAEAWQSSTDTPDETFLHWIFWDNIGALFFLGISMLSASVVCGSIGSALALITSGTQKDGAACRDTPAPSRRTPRRQCWWRSNFRLPSADYTLRNVPRAEDRPAKASARLFDNIIGGRDARDPFDAARAALVRDGPGPRQRDRAAERHGRRLGPNTALRAIRLSAFAVRGPPGHRDPRSDRIYRLRAVSRRAAS